MNVNKNETGKFRTSQLYNRDVQSLNRSAQLNFNTSESFYKKRAKSLENFFLQLWKSDFADFLQIKGNKCI